MNWNLTGIAFHSITRLFFAQVKLLVVAEGPLKGCYIVCGDGPAELHGQPSVTVQSHFHFCKYFSCHKMW